MLSTWNNKFLDWYIKEDNSFRSFGMEIIYQLFNLVYNGIKIFFQNFCQSIFK